jgi:hypothetical protein
VAKAERLHKPLRKGRIAISALWTLLGGNNILRPWASIIAPYGALNTVAPKSFRQDIKIVPRYFAEL